MQALTSFYSFVTEIFVILYYLRDIFHARFHGHLIQSTFPLTKRMKPFSCFRLSIDTMSAALLMNQSLDRLLLIVAVFVHSFVSLFSPFVTLPVVPFLQLTLNFTCLIFSTMQHI